MEKQRMIDLYRGENIVFHVGDTQNFSFDTDKLWKGSDPANYRFRLFVKGEPSADAATLSEWGGGLFLRNIDDSLSTVTHHSRYSLRFQATDEPAERRAYYKLLCENLTYPGGLGITQLPEDHTWTFSFYTKGVNFQPLGEAEIRAEIYHKKEGRSPQDILDEADEILRFPIRSGTYDFCRTEGSIRIDGTVAAIVFVISVGASEGELFLEDVGLRGVTDLSVLPRFMPSSGYSPTLNWFGENLSHHEWSDFEIEINGKSIGKHGFFSSIYRYNETELPIDASCFVQGENTVSFTHVSDYFNPAPYQIIQISLLVEEKQPFYLVACPHTATLGAPLAVTVETAVDGLCIEAKTSSGMILPRSPSTVCDECGLHAILFDVVGMTGACEITLSANGYTQTCRVARVVLRGKDGVLCGTGDDVYIAQTEDAKREYIKWYLANECGSFLTFRPVYHWSGTRSLKEAVWKKTVPFLNKIGLPYCVLFDERELSGLNANPTRDLLEGPYFMGYQGHERDGAHYYWGNGMWGYNGSFYWELRDRILRHPDVSYHVPPQYNGNQVYTYRDPDAVSNVQEAVDRFERSVAETMRGFQRHTGVTLLFRHFARAGIEVLGAETMYANHEILLSGLRGTAYAYSKPATGAHLALQWHVAPVGRRGFHEKYELSLHLSYLHGVSHINTEEGLWRMEHDFESHDRFSPYCQRNVEIKRKFLRFIQSHTRLGAPARRHGILYGNAESAISYFCPAVWNKEKEGWERGAPEEAWELIRVLYPEATTYKPRRIQTEEPKGWFSSTPYGLCDIVPIEASEEKLAEYPYLAFLGYHLSSKEWNAHLLEYVKNGGTLLLCLCHLSDDGDRPALKQPSFATHLAEGYEELTGFEVKEIAYDGYRRAIADWSGVTVKRTNDAGEPLVIENRVGNGRVILVNTYEYPCHEAICGVYAEELRALADAVKTEDLQTGDIETLGNPVEYATYLLEGGVKRFYLTDVAWHKEEDTCAELCMDGERYRLPVKRGEIGIVNLNRDVATYTCDATTEVLDVTRADGRVCVHLQGEGRSRVWVFGKDVGEHGSAEIEALLEGETYLYL